MELCVKNVHKWYYTIYNTLQLAFLSIWFGTYESSLSILTVALSRKFSLPAPTRPPPSPFRIYKLQRRPLISLIEITCQYLGITLGFSAWGTLIAQAWSTYYLCSQRLSVVGLQLHLKDCYRKK